MKFLSKVMLVVTIMSFSQLASAYKQCDNLTVGYIFNDGTNTYIGISSGSNLYGMIRNSSSEYEQIFSIVLAARVSGQKLTVRFVDDSAVCGSTPWHTEVLGVGF